MNHFHVPAFVIAAFILALTGCAKQENLLKHQALCSVLGSEKMCQPDQEVALRAIGTDSSGRLFETEATCTVSRDGQVLAADVRVHSGAPGKFTVMKSLSPLYIICRGNGMYSEGLLEAQVKQSSSEIAAEKWGRFPFSLAGGGLGYRAVRADDVGFYYPDKMDVRMKPSPFQPH